MITKIPSRRIVVSENGQIQIREEVIIAEDGIELVRVHPHSRTLDPGDHTETDNLIVGIINVVWTPEVIAEFKRKKEEAASELKV